MTLNKQKGNMYGFVTHTWNPIKGKCIHDCDYCYMKVYEQKPIHLVEKELKDDLGKDNFIFIGSSTDIFASDVKISWIEDVLETCRKYPENKYLFQTKNPERLFNYINYFPSNTLLGTTIETNRVGFECNAPSVIERAKHMRLLSENFPIMITVEPIIDFDLKEFVELIKSTNPRWVNIGADSKNHNLPEPSKEKILALVDELSKFTEVKNKNNIERLLNGDN